MLENKNKNWKITLIQIHIKIKRIFNYLKEKSWIYLIKITIKNKILLIKKKKIKYNELCFKIYFLF